LKYFLGAAASFIKHVLEHAKKLRNHKGASMKKRIVIISGIATAGVIGLASVGLVSAQTAGTGQSNLITKIAQKFNLKEADVKSVFDEQRTANQAAHQADEKAQLDQAVKDGKLTQAQEDLIVAKQTEMKTFIDSLSGKTPTERKTAMDTKRVELDKWAADNNIPQQYLRMGGHGHGMGGRGGKMGGRGNDGDADDAATSTTAPTATTN
jgi:hypothetical protein